MRNSNDTPQELPEKAEMRKLAEAAMLHAMRDVADLAERTGTPVIVWEDGRVKRLTPQEARARLPKDSAT